jgi:hypothetical protein
MGVDEIGDDGFDGRGPWEVNVYMLFMNSIMEADDECGRVINAVADLTIMYWFDGVVPIGGREGRYVLGYKFCLIAARDLRDHALELSSSVKFFDDGRLRLERPGVAIGSRAREGM